MVDFVCPGILGKYSAFNKQYEKPILKARSLGCPPEALKEGKDRGEEVGPSEADASVLKASLACQTLK